ncbi:YtoQ family protein [Vibrio sp.]|nr:YtoQ family protein [Vibrio sp.]
MTFHVYLSGEIHTQWREEIIQGCDELGLNISFSSAVTNHESSDAAGDVLRLPEDGFWRDNQSAKINAIRTQNAIKQCDLAIIRFGNQYKQWNAAFDAGFCAALGKPYITLHDESIIHPLKEVDASAQGWATSPSQVIEILKYTLSS